MPKRRSKQRKRTGIFFATLLLLGVLWAAINQDWGVNNRQKRVDDGVNQPREHSNNNDANPNKSNSPSLPQLRQTALALANRDRAERGLPPLKLDPELSQAAQAYAEKMLREDFFDHVSPEGKTAKDRVEHIVGIRGVGENLAKQKASYRLNVDKKLLKKFQQGWMDSPGHRKNILNANFTHFGYGIASDEGEVYAVQKFLIKY